MNMSPGISIGLLADHPPLIPAVGEMRWREWGHPRSRKASTGGWRSPQRRRVVTVFRLILAFPYHSSP